MRALFSPAALLIVGALTWSARGWGADPPAPRGEGAGRSARLQWQRLGGAERCISGEELAATLQRRLRRGTIGGPEAEVTLEGSIAPAEGRPGWKAWIVVRDRDEKAVGAREVASDEASCRALDEALLLVLSTIVDPSMALEPAPPPSPPKVVRRPGNETAWHVAIGGGGALGLVPGLGAGVSASAGVRPWGGPVLELEGAHWFANQAERAGGSAAVSATYGAVNVCWLPIERGPWSLGGCVGAQGGVVSVDGGGLSGENLAPSRLIGNAAARVEARLALGDPFFLRFLLGGAVPLVRDRFFFDAPGGESVSLFRLSPVIGTASVQGGLRFR
ncbi:MAG: hypothetical protein MUF34_29970 [Polyangiaceae bacterium]|nr:hypothetical protein [Polyangiaceae bacterium]